MCCFKNLKNFEKLNNMVQVICSVAIRVIQTMPDDFDKEQNKSQEEKSSDKKEKNLEDKDKGESSIQGLSLALMCAEM